MREREVQSHVQQKAEVFSGNKPTRVKVRIPVARVACAEETKRMESIDKAIPGMASKSSGRNESKSIGDLENPKSRGRTHDWRVKAAWIAAI
jgi:hypothetical protein